jgi:hypothetical protein
MPIHDALHCLIPRVMQIRHLISFLSIVLLCFLLPSSAPKDAVVKHVTLTRIMHWNNRERERERERERAREKEMERPIEGRGRERTRDLGERERKGEREKER